MRRILVTGANKGIGLAIVRAILDEHADTFVYLGARDPRRGQDAVDALVAEKSERKARIAFVELDVTSDASVEAAAAGVERLYAIVNNAGINGADLATTLDVNVYGVRRVSEAFAPLLDPNGRVVNVTSASGPIYVSKQSDERRRFLVDASKTWDELAAFMQEQVRAGADDAYGLSKACANAYTRIFAREHRALQVNACTPGYIDTDLTRRFVGKEKSAADLGMKPPSEGARAPMHLLFGKLDGNGHYYGSDAQRSPLDRYRAPGSAPYMGDE